MCIHQALEEMLEKMISGKDDLRKGSADVGSAWIWQSAALSAFSFSLCRCADHFIVLLLLNCPEDFAVPYS
jgi:hypothetical protein